MKYRSRTEIVGHILDAANGGTTKTKIMYRAFLSYAQLKEYLALLHANGLLEYDQAAEKYRTTARGLKFLALNSQMDVLTASMPSSESMKPHLRK